MPMLWLLAAIAGSAGAPPAGSSTDGPARKMWVFFSDKGFADAGAEACAVESLAAHSDPRQVSRRASRRSAPGLFDARDLPVCTRYVQGVEATGARVHAPSRWLNGVSVLATPEQQTSIRELPFVRDLAPVRGGRRHEDRPAGPVPAGEDASFYGYAAQQTVQVGLDKLHALGFTGAGVIVGVLDTGFQRSHAVFNNPVHPLQVIAEWDFINGDGNTQIEPTDHPDQHFHGTIILSVLGAYKPDELVGGAYDASFVLCKTEDYTSETPVEEDNYVAGLEFIEMHGADVATSSLGYIDWYQQSDLDGQTAVTTIAVNTATENGLHCCTAMGNQGHDANPATSNFLAPADAARVISCGAADSNGFEAWFTSDGPTADGRDKPEVMARGVDTACIWPWDDVNYASASGTSLSTPIVAAAVACLTGARPGWSVDRMRTYLTRTASDFVLNGAPDPLHVRGYGVIDAFGAYTIGCPADFNGDLFVTGDDFDSFVGAFEAGDPGADHNGDGFVTGDDFDGFVSDFESGC